VAIQQVQNDKEGKLTVLVTQLAADSRQLVMDEVELAKLSVVERARAASRGLAGISAAFGIAVIAATLATVLLALLLAELTGRAWAGALIVGAAELLAGLLFFLRGRATLTFDRDQSK
jgi:hypothetical protein